MNERRHLVVNADDFGMSPGVSRGILAAHANGIVTSTSLMVRPAAAAEAVAMSREYPRLGLGLHVELCEWEFADGEWRLTWEVVSLQDEAAIAEEVLRQYEKFRDLVGSEPTHIDAHQHFHLIHPGLRERMVELAARVGVPVRHCTPGVQYISGFYGQSAEGDPVPDAITVSSLLNLLASVPPGISELACHPGDGADLNSYRSERAVEQHVLCDPAVRAAVDREAITLCSFAEVADLLPLQAR